MILEIVGIVVAILMVNSAVGDPSLEIIYKKLTIKTVDNPYFGEMTSEISNSGETGSAKFPIKKTFPETAKMFLTVELEGNQIKEFEDNLCELMKNEIYGKDMIKHGLPADQFPKGCPVIPGDYEVSKYPIPADKFPPGTPPGDYIIQMLIGEPDQDPWITIDVILGISHKAPDLPAPGLGR